MKATVPERENAYPGQRTLGILSAYGLLLQQVRNLTLDGLDLSYDPEQCERRPVLVIDESVPQGGRTISLQQSL